jgi:anti-sigma B factor antagonist
MHTSRPVVVLEVPEQLDKAECEAFQKELQSLMEGERPRIVLDCCQVRQIDSLGVEMLLYCMDEVMKRDGDVKLAALSPEVAIILELMKVDRLFEIFESTDEAVESFHSFPLYESTPTEQRWLEGAGSLEAAS